MLKQTWARPDKHLEIFPWSEFAIEFDAQGDEED